MLGSRLGWAGLGWAGLGWAGLGWAGLGWAGLGWAGLGWAGLGCRPGSIGDYPVRVNPDREYPTHRGTPLLRSIVGVEPSDTNPLTRRASGEFSFTQDPPPPLKMYFHIPTPLYIETPPVKGTYCIARKIWYICVPGLFGAL